MVETERPFGMRTAAEDLLAVLDALHRPFQRVSAGKGIKMQARRCLTGSQRPIGKAVSTLSGPGPVEEGSPIREASLASPDIAHDKAVLRDGFFDIRPQENRPSRSGHNRRADSF